MPPLLVPMLLVPSLLGSLAGAPVVATAPLSASVSVPASVAASVAASTVRPGGCAAAPSWVDRTPTSMTRPYAGVVVRTWTGRGQDRSPVRVVAVQADTRRYAVAASTTSLVGAGATTTALTARVGAVAGINGDYFARGVAGIEPRGVQARGGHLLRTPGGASRFVGVGDDGTVQSGRARVDGSVTVTTAGGRRHVLTVSAVNGSGRRVPGWGVALFTSYGPPAPAGAGWYVLVRRGVVVVSGPTGPRGRVRPGDVLVVSRSRAAEGLAAARVGRRVVVEGDLYDLGGTRIVEAVGSGGPLLDDGAIVADCRSRLGRALRPRSIVAWNSRTHRVWFVTVQSTGRGSARPGSRGFSYGESADLARRLGATDAVMLDGGSSTTLAVTGGAGPRRVDGGATGAQARVPDALVLLRR